MRCYFSILHTLALQIRPDSRWPERAGRADPTVCTATRPNGLSFSLGITTLLIPLFWRTGGAAETSLQLGVLCLGLFVDGNVGVGVFPGVKEVLIGSFGVVEVAAQAL